MRLEEVDWQGVREARERRASLEFLVFLVPLALRFLQVACLASLELEFALEFFAK